MTTRIADRVAEAVAAPSGAAAFAVSASKVWQNVSGLAGSYQTFANIPGIAANDTVFYTAYDGSGNSESGLGTWTSGSLARTTILDSSNSGAACSFSGTVTVFGSAPQALIVPQPAIVSSGTSATAGATSRLIMFSSSSSGAKSVSTSNNWIGQVVTIKDGKGDFNTNPMTFTPASGTVDGQSSYAFGQPFGSISFTFDGTNWWVSP